MTIPLFHSIIIITFPFQRLSPFKKQNNPQPSESKERFQKKPLGRRRHLMSEPSGFNEFSTVTSGTERKRGFVGTFLAFATLSHKSPQTPFPYPFFLLCTCRIVFLLFPSFSFFLFLFLCSCIFFAASLGRIKHFLSNPTKSILSAFFNASNTNS